MNIQEYINQKKDLYNSFQEFIECEDADVRFKDKAQKFKNHHIDENENELRILLHLISQVSKNHHRSPGFIDKIKQILEYFEEKIKQSFTNLELFEIFKRNKLILLFLIEKKIITVDKCIADLIIYEKPTEENEKKTKEKSNPINLSYYFYPEIKQFLSKDESQKIESFLLKDDSEIFESFDKKRHDGENESVLCNLIRNNSVEEFISYINLKQISPSSRLKHSIFETNPLLIKLNPSLIEYAAFYGSIEIVQFLEKNQVALDPNLWLYAIHGKNPHIIHFLEENRVKPPNESYFFCLKEAIKCHHNDFANYINDNLLTKKDKKKYENQIMFDCGFDFYNFDFVQSDFNEKDVFFHSCQYDYITIVENLLKSKKFTPNDKIISTIN